MSDDLNQLPAVSMPGDSLPANLASEARRFAGNARAANTVRAYRADWNHFDGWCAANGFEPLPASVDVLIGYVVSMATRNPKPFAVSTITRRVSAIASAHHVAGHASPASHPQFREVFKGIRRDLGAKPDQAKPIDEDTLRALIRSTDDSTMGARDRLLLLLGFRMAARRSELAALRFEDIKEEGDRLRVTIGKSKTDQEGHGRDIGIPKGTGPKFCAVAAFNAWRDESGLDSGPLFPSITKGGKTKASAISGRDVARVIQRIARKAVKLGELSSDEGFRGHSLRSGFASSAAANSASAISIQRQGGWKSSEMVGRYVRHGSLYVDNACDSLSL